MAIGALEPHFYDILLAKLKLNDEDYPQFDDYEENRKKFVKIFKTKTQDEWCELFDGSDACVTPVLTFDDVAHHKHNKSQGTFCKTSDDLTIPNPTPRLSRTPGVSCSKNSFNINIGEHTMEILKELDYKSDEIKNFLDNDVVVQFKKSKI